VSPEYSPLDREVLHPALRALLARIQAMQDIDPLMLYEWLRPRIETLRVQFYLGDRPTTDFDIWSREQFLNHKVLA
jgi:hypothetical protein